MDPQHRPDDGVRVEHGRVSTKRRGPDDGVRAELGKGAQQ